MEIYLIDISKDNPNPVTKIGSRFPLCNIGKNDIEMLKISNRQTLLPPQNKEK